MHPFERGIDESIEEDVKSRKRRHSRVGTNVQQTKPRGGRGDRKEKGCTAGEEASNQWPVLGPGHLRIVLRFKHHVQSIGTAGREEGARSQVEEGQCGGGKSREWNNGRVEREKCRDRIHSIRGSRS